jgi:hypothetical protein
MNRVVVTGIGIYSSLGVNLEAVTNSLFQGKSGIVFRPERKAMGYRSALTGYVERPNLKGLLDRRARIMMPEQAEFAYMATAEALRLANIDIDFLAANETGILYGNDSCAKPVIDGIDGEKGRDAYWFRIGVSGAEFYRYYEPGYNIQITWCQFYDQRSMCQRFSCNWYGVSLYKKWHAGSCYLWRSSGNQ